jgi:phosphohistidine phosphatase
LPFRCVHRAQRSRQLQHGCVLAFARPGEQHGLPVGELQRIVMQDAPLGRAVQRSGVIVAIPILSGLHHQYVAERHIISPKREPRPSVSPWRPATGAGPGNPHAILPALNEGSQCGGEPDEFRLIQVMKTLFLIRHAKSSWDDTALPDKDRPLGDRGRRDAPKMGKRLAKRDVKPDLILSSPARRALTTAEIIAKKLDYKLKDIVVDDRLYAGAVHSLLNVIHGLGDKPERVMLFGHNPELTEFAHRLSGEITHMPTCAVAEFTFSAKSWRNIGKANLARVALDYPKKKKS